MRLKEILSVCDNSNGLVLFDHKTGEIIESYDRKYEVKNELMKYKVKRIYAYYRGGNMAIELVR